MTDLDQSTLCSTATAQQRDLTNGKYSSVDLTKAYLSRCEKLNSVLNAFVQVDPALAMDMAERADALRRAGYQSPVLGLSVGIKDLIDVAGLKTTYGSQVFADNVAKIDAPAVRRLREAGAVILGKVNTTEFAMFSPNTICGSSKNPWNLARSAGGSSNGSATAASASLCSFAIGTDTAGSIRTPSAMCGLWGIKPTHGLVSAAGIGELSRQMDTVGVLARSVEDIARVMQVIAGYEPDDMTSRNEPIPDYLGELGEQSDLRVGAPEFWISRDMHPEVLSAWKTALGKLEQNGATVTEVELPNFSELMMVWRGLAAGDALMWHHASLSEKGDLYSDHVKFVLENCRSATALDVSQAKQRSWEWKCALRDALKDKDVIILPVMPVPAPTDDEVRQNQMKVGDKVIPASLITDCCMPFNVTGLPSMTAPVGMSSDGLPIAVQIVSAPFREDAIFRAGMALSRLMPFDPNPPQFCS